jgi:hypothetical protein
VLVNNAGAPGMNANALKIDLDTSAHKAAAAEMRGESPPKPVIRRETEDAAAINRILNDPSVFPLVSIPDQGPFDIAPLLADPRNVFLMAEGGVIIAHQLELGFYEIHTNFIKKGRHERREIGAGPYIKNCCIEAYRWLFTHTDAIALLGRIPEHNRALRVFAPLIGWVLEFERKAVWPTHSGPVDMSFWSIRYDDWVRKSDGLIESGQRFHERLEQEYERLGFVDNPHPQEDCHDRRVGALVEMILGGQPEKAVALYNLWARFAGYGLIRIEHLASLLFDMGGPFFIHVIPGRRTFNLLPKPR